MKSLTLEKITSLNRKSYFGFINDILVSAKKLLQLGDRNTLVEYQIGFLIHRPGQGDFGVLPL